MGCSTQGYFCSLFLVIFIACAIAGIILDGASVPNGELGVYYAVDGCLSNTDSFNIAGRGYFDTFLMRGTPSENEQRGSACPATPIAASNVNITLEEDDEYRAAGTYSPVLVLPSSTYAMMSFSVVDASGSVLLPASIISLGPDENYPWTVEASAISYPTASPPATAPPATGAPGTVSTSSATSGSCCTDTCPSFASDGACDDGGPGSQYSVCTQVGSDCTDCGSRCSRRRLLYSTDNLDAELGAAWEGEEAYSADRSFVAVPGARRILKGGSSGGSSGGSGGSYSSSRASYSSGASRASYISSSTRTSYTSYGSSRTYNSRSYGGYSSYYVGNRYYYMSSRPYSYYYGYHWYYPGTTFIIVSRYGYGCYSCGGYYRTCYSCSGCYNRRDCSGGRDSSTLDTNFDRYEISFTFDVPVAESPKWPLTLMVNNYTLFYPRGTSPLPMTTAATAYVTFVTDSGDGLKSAGGALSPIGFVGIIIVAFYMICNRRILFPARAQQQPAFRGASEMASFHNQQPVGYGRPVVQQQFQPQMVAPMAVAQPVYAQPAMAYPGQAGPAVYANQQPMAYGYPQQQQLPVATYVSPPTSPPEEYDAPAQAEAETDARNKDE